MFDLLKTGESIAPTRLCVVDQLAQPYPAGPPLCQKRIFPQVRELINLTVERQHRCAGIKAGRSRILMRQRRRGVGLLLCLASCLSIERGSEVKWRDWKKTHLICTGWLMGSHACRQATWTCIKNKRSVSVLSVINANILTFDMKIILEKCDSHLRFLMSCQLKLHQYSSSYLIDLLGPL